MPEMSAMLVGWLIAAFVGGCVVGWLIAGMAFKAMAADALANNNKAFLDLAEERLKRQQSDSQHDLQQRQTAIESMVKPLGETLTKLEALTQTARTETVSVKELLPTLQQEVSRLNQAMRTPHTRGRWGEEMLRRTVELAGMTEHINFLTQENFEHEGQRYRPDMLVQLPNGMQVIVDSKTPLTAYLDAQHTQDAEQRRQLMQQHATHVRNHIKQLSSKAYQDTTAAGSSIDCTVLFIPGEDAFRAALEIDKELLDVALAQKILLASPFTLIALLKAVEYGWRQQKITQSAEDMAKMGRELHDRLAVFSEHFGKVGKALSNANTAYNDAISSFASRLMPSARRLGEMTKPTKELPDLSTVDVEPQTFEADVRQLPQRRESRG